MSLRMSLKSEDLNIILLVVDSAGILKSKISKTSIVLNEQSVMIPPSSNLRLNYKLLIANLFYFIDIYNNFTGEPYSLYVNFKAVVELGLVEHPSKIVRHSIKVLRSTRKATVSSLR